MSKELVTKVVKRTGSGIQDWKSIDIGVNAQNVMLDESNVAQIMNNSTGGRNYLADTDKRSLICLEQNETTHDYQGINEIVYTTIGGKTLGQLGFKEGDYITLSFDWAVKELDANKTYIKDDSDVISANDIIWVEPENDKTQAAEIIVTQLINDEYKNLFSKSFTSFVVKKDEQLQDITKTIDYSRRVSTNDNYEFDTVTTAKEYKLYKLAREESGHEKVTLPITSDLLELSKITIQSPTVKSITKTGQGEQSESIGYYVCKHIVAEFELVIENFMLERGMKASDWRPASEDIQSMITGVKIPIQTKTDFKQAYKITLPAAADTEYLLELNGYCTLINNLAFINMEATVGRAWSQLNNKGNRISVILGYVPAPLYDLATVTALHSKRGGSNNEDLYYERVPLTGSIRRNDSQNYFSDEDKAMPYYGSIQVSNLFDSVAVHDKIWINGCYEIHEDTLKFFSNDFTIPAQEESEEESESGTQPEPEGKDTYTITFNADGGSYVAPIQVNIGQSISQTLGTDYSLPVPTKENYVFNGWEIIEIETVVDDSTGEVSDVERETGIAISTSFKPTEDTLVKAKWGTQSDVVPTETRTQIWNNEDIKTYTASNPTEYGYWTTYTSKPSSGSKSYPWVGTTFYNGSSALAYDKTNGFFYLSGSSTKIGATPKLIFNESHHDFEAKFTLTQKTPYKGWGRWSIGLNDANNVTRFMIWQWDKSSDYSTRPIYYRSIGPSGVTSVQNSGTSVSGHWAESTTSTLTYYFTVTKRGQVITFTFYDKVNGTTYSDKKVTKTITLTDANDWDLKSINFHLQRDGNDWTTKVWYVKVDKITTT